MEEKISLYANDLMLYLGSSIRSSIRPAMAIIKEFGGWSGLQINWDKSVLHPLDPLLDTLPAEAAQLQVVSKFHYLWIQISARP